MTWRIVSLFLSSGRADHVQGAKRDITRITTISNFCSTFAIRLTAAEIFQWRVAGKSGNEIA